MLVHGHKSYSVGLMAIIWKKKILELNERNFGKLLYLRSEIQASQRKKKKKTVYDLLILLISICEEVI